MFSNERRPAKDKLNSRIICPSMNKTIAQLSAALSCKWHNLSNANQLFQVVQYNDNIYSNFSFTFGNQNESRVLARYGISSGWLKTKAFRHEIQARYVNSGVCMGDWSNSMENP